MFCRNCWLIMLGIGLMSFRQGPDTPAIKRQQLLVSAGKMLQERHYSPRAFNDGFSKTIWVNFMHELDPLKQLFLQKDLAALAKYQSLLDDELRGEKPLRFLPAVLKIYRSRVEEARAGYRELLSVPFAFNVKEEVNADGSSTNSYPKNEQERKIAWRKRLHLLVLQKYVALQDGGKDDAALEKEARNKVKLRLERSFEKMIAGMDIDHQLHSYINTILHFTDPHTEYMPPAEERAFMDRMSNRFGGIGIQLDADDDGARVVNTDSTQTAIAVNDIILKIAQGANGEWQETAGMEVQEIAGLIRGEAGSLVRLLVKKTNGETAAVSLERKPVSQEESFVKTAIIVKEGRKIGYISFPLFYQDPNPFGPKVSDDVGFAIQFMEQQQAEAIVFDLRRNGGGSMQEVVKMLGMLLPGGPVVQVKERDGLPVIKGERVTNQLYNGPLTVMVDGLSASAAEIFAAAIQDYGRGVVIGSASTYGKGTVQGSFRMPDEGTGIMKLTHMQFYRVNGISTQLKGVVPDVILPDMNGYLPLRERDQPNALDWNMVAPADYTVWNNRIDLQRLKTQAGKRIQQDTAFMRIEKNVAWLADHRQQKVNLEINAFKAGQAERKQRLAENEKARSLPAGEELDVKPGGSNASRSERWLKSLGRDVYLRATVDVVMDMLM